MRGPLLGDVEGGAAAAVFGVRASVISGGVLCILGVLVCGALLPRFMRYDARSFLRAQADRVASGADGGPRVAGRSPLPWCWRCRPAPWPLPSIPQRYTPVVPLLPGTRLGPYEIVDLVGAGGMGEVYRAIDTRLTRSAAIKELALLARAARQRCESAARPISALSHPHTCARSAS